jgi:putative oxidoreductase
MNQLHERFLHLENRLHHQLVIHSVTMLRIAVGAVFLGFGVLKYFPGISPAQNLTEATTHIMFFGVVPGRMAMIGVATLECFIGAALIAGRPMRVALWLLGAEFAGILSPLVLLPARLFAGPHHAPTLEGQYVLKDVILVGAAMVIAAATFRGGRLVRGDLPPTATIRPGEELDGAQKLRLVLEGASDQHLVTELCERQGISQVEYYEWREAARAGAVHALDRLPGAGDFVGTGPRAQIARAGLTPLPRAPANLGQTAPGRGGAGTAERVTRDDVPLVRHPGRAHSATHEYV